MPRAYYNEFDPYAAQWLRNLIAAGHIAPGDVDQRSIEDVAPLDLAGYTQCHFFAGIGVWSFALRLAGWSDSRPVWTGSCPCQPFSQAGEGRGFSDERHLWPAWFHLITQREPCVVFGEQVASKDGLAWLDLVQTDLEAAGYARGAVDLCAAGVGAPHIRQRLWLVAESPGEQYTRSTKRPEQAGWTLPWNGCQLGDSQLHGFASNSFGSEVSAGEIGRGLQQHQGPSSGFWDKCEWVECRDGKWRPIEPGTFPLVNEAPARVGRLRAYGNAINAEAALAVIESYMECRP